MRYKRIRSIIMAGVLGMLNVLFAYSQPADSLGYYLEPVSYTHLTLPTIA